MGATEDLIRVAQSMGYTREDWQNFQPVGYLS